MVVWERSATFSSPNRGKQLHVPAALLLQKNKEHGSAFLRHKSDLCCDLALWNLPSIQMGEEAGWIPELVWRSDYGKGNKWCRESNGRRITLLSCPALPKSCERNIPLTDLKYFCLYIVHTEPHLCRWMTRHQLEQTFEINAWRTLFILRHSTGMLEPVTGNFQIQSCLKALSLTFHGAEWLIP
jgi:hypothetical protein